MTITCIFSSAIVDKWRKDGVHFEGVFLKLRVFILGFCVSDSFRVSNPQRLNYTQISVEYSPPRDGVLFILYSVSHF